MFTTAEGQYLRRSNFTRRALRSATDGTLDRKNPPARRVHPVKPGLTFHGLRHSHKTWMIADAVPEIAQAARLGHTLDDKIQQVYSHIAAEVEQRLLDGLHTRWTHAVTNVDTHSTTPAWRTHP